MKVDFSIDRVEEDPVDQRKLELVERKGKGHPDSICDGIAEAVSRALSQEYIDRFDEVLHHNTDEVQLVAGSSNPRFGGGEVKEPIFMLLAGRATRVFQDQEVPVDRIAMDAARNYIEQNFQELETSHIELESRIGETSSDLESVFSSGARKSNDTSFGVGHAPLSPAETAVRQIEQELHSRIDAVGEDVKVMGLREGDRLKLTVAAAVISSQVETIEEYQDIKQKIQQVTEEVVENHTELVPGIHVNTADEPQENSVYLTVTGTSAEMGDDGSVGRGNRVNGLITPHRSMSLEAASGKNPETHVGKIYNLLAQDIAREIHDTTGKFAGVKLLSQIGKPVNQPQAVEVETAAGEDVVDEVVQQKFDSIEDITKKCIRGELETF